jgi:hypothetical protein
MLSKASRLQLAAVRIANPLGKRTLRSSEHIATSQCAKGLELALGH